MNQFRKVSRFTAIHEYRCYIEVLDPDGKRQTIGVCPACFNKRERRKQILDKLKEKGYKIVSKDDELDGKYYKTSVHSPFCPYK
ncbi:MAG: hypothetical protein WH035_02365 [Spirochaetota bacterium]|nr:hypothetical protein [Exilispira sp.]